VRFLPLTAEEAEDMPKDRVCAIRSLREAAAWRACSRSEVDGKAAACPLVLRLFACEEESALSELLLSACLCLLDEEEKLLLEFRFLGRLPELTDCFLFLLLLLLTPSPSSCKAGVQIGDTTGVHLGSAKQRVG
jgi:hypothetical protein